ncbi:MAG: SpoIVB peptidase [Firmicutes bacterium]|nr:SpoIVB peptidase [Bacillota bacterium]
MYEARGKSLWGRAAALCAAILLALTVCVRGAYAQEKTVIPLGQAVGIKLFADGVLVVDVSELEDGRSPALQCGIREGDLLLTFNGEKIVSTEHLQELLRENGDKAAQRAWIRDSMAGIGTMTYYDPESGSFGALGHGITDVDTAQLMSLGSGSIMETTVKAVKKGEKGEPGELKGDFSVQRDVGTVTVNSDGGIFGTVSDADFPARSQAVPVAGAEEVKPGSAVILSTVSGEEIREYQVEIVKVFRDADSTRNLLLRITDPELLQATGGIVQGMSGSPILQNGKLVGAVTHVMINDPSQGYGIFAENMLVRAG